MSVPGGRPYRRRKPPTRITFDVIKARDAPMWGRRTLEGSHHLWPESVFLRDPPTHQPEMAALELGVSGDGEALRPPDRGENGGEW